jgi:membrane protein implicated in regulation of membrane protease activity
LEAIEGDVMGKDRLDPHTAADVADTLSSLAVGAGIVTIALAPLSIPILALTAVALLPLLVPVLAVGVLIALVVLPVRLVRAFARRRLAQRRPGVSLRETSGLAR